MHSRVKRKFHAVDIDGLPVGPIGKALGLDLDAAPLRFTRAAQKHAHDRHPNEFDLCLDNIERLVRNPLYAGEDFKNRDKFEIVSKVRASDDAQVFILVAITIEIQSDDCYHIASCYRLSEDTVNNRREKDRLKVVTYT